MFKKFKQWRATRQEQAYSREFNNGFDWAAGELLRRTATPAEIESYYYFNSDAFDKGAQAATDLLCNSLIVDDRI